MNSELDGGTVDAPLVGQVIGENLRRIRQERQLTQEELVGLWTTVGLDWPRTKLSVLESGGRSSVSLSEAVLMAVALGVRLPDLLRLEGRVRLHKAVRTVPMGLLITWLEGAVSTEEIASELKVPTAGGVTTPTTAEAALAERLNVPIKEVEYAAVHLFGVSLTEERDRRVRGKQPQSLAERTAVRGHVTRQLEDLIAERLREKGQLRD